MFAGVVNIWPPVISSLLSSDTRFGPAERRDLRFLLFDSLTIADVLFDFTGPEREKQMFLDNILFSKCSQRSPQGLTEVSGYLI